jgi:hypothetical protein
LTSRWKNPDSISKQPFVSRHWITNAIDCGTKEVVAWMLSMGAPVLFHDEEGFTVLHSAIDRGKPDRLEIMAMLLEAGADINARGINDWTPAHHAAVRNDVEALKFLVESGADLTIRTRIDEYATPLEEAVRSAPQNRPSKSWPPTAHKLLKLMPIFVQSRLYEHSIVKPPSVLPRNQAWAHTTPAGGIPDRPSSSAPTGSVESEPVHLSPFCRHPPP